jgi:enolase
MPDLRIVSVTGREILDSRGRPTVEADVILADGALGRASVPSGVSTGRHEAVELRDGDPARYRGLGVLRAVANVNGEIAAAVRGLRADHQRSVDDRVISTDGEPRKARLGANAALAVSLATCRAAAVGRRVPLYRHIADLAGTEPSIPLPMVNIISGGLHAGRQVDIQDVLAIPLAAASFRAALESAVAIYNHVGDMVQAAGYPPLAADEGGWGPPLGSDREAIDWVARAIVAEGTAAGIGLDIAASHFFDREAAVYRLASVPGNLGSVQMISVIAEWVREYPIVSVEDGLAEDDWAGWTALTSELRSVQLVGDDLFVTDNRRLDKGIARGIANAVLVKPNQVGTLSESLDVVAAARRHGYGVVVSARSGETEDSFLADLAVGTGAGQIKVGSVTRSSRLAKWNQLLRIEEELGAAAYVGAAALAGQRRLTGEIDEARPDHP